MKLTFICIITLCIGVILGILAKQYSDTYVSDTTTREVLHHLSFIDVNVSSSLVGEGAGWISVAPDSESFISYVFDFNAKEIGIINYALNDKLMETEKYNTPAFNKAFTRLVLTEKELLWYPSLASKNIFYQPIKEADFDTFVILPWGMVAMDKNHIYALSNLQAWSDFRHDGRPWASTASQSNRSSLTPTNWSWDYRTYYTILPPEVRRDEFQVFRNFYVVQRDGVYAFGERIDDIVIPSRFIHDNTPQEI